MRTLPLLLLAVTTFAADLPNGGAIDAIAQREGRGYRQMFDPRGPYAKPTRILLVGDSILNGHQKKTTELLSGSAVVNVWINPNATMQPREVYVAYQHLVNGKPHPYEVVFFHQSIDDLKYVKTDKLGQMMKEHVMSIRSKLPKARLIWASATPITEKEDPAALNAKINPVIVERNRIVAKIMEEMDVEVIDLYGLLVDKTHLAFGNSTHWKEPAYDLISQKVAETILKDKSSN
jgi:hypothetical protein